MSGTFNALRGSAKTYHQTTLSDLVQISPEDVEKPSGESIEDNINAKYANKVDYLFFALCLRC